MGATVIDVSEVAGTSPISLSGLEPQIAQLGLAVGLLQNGATAGTYDVNVQWFENPLANTKAALTANGGGLAGLLEAVLGSLGGTALGIPSDDTDSLGTWYPVLNPQTQQPTGLYIVAQTAGNITIFGIGVNHTWTLTQTLSVRAWALAPLISVGGNSVESAYSNPDAALTVGIETVSSTPLVNAYGLQLGGMRLSGSLIPGSGASISLEATGLQLPGESKPSDRSLADLEQLTGAQILSTVSTVFVAAMSEALEGDTTNATLGYVLPVLGLSPVLPSPVTKLFPGVQMPVLRWDEIVGQATATDGDLGKPFKDWFNTLLSDSQTMLAWLASIQGLEGLTVAAGSGDGSRANPWSIAILTNSSVGTLSFTFATTTDQTGIRTFYPGLNFAGVKYDLGGNAALRVSADLEVAQFVLAPSKTSVSIDDLEFDLGIELVGSGQTAGVDNPVFTGTIGTDSYTFGALAAGLRISDTSGTLSVVPSFTLSNLVTPQGTFKSLDLLQPGDVVNAAEKILVGLVNSALQKLFGISGNSDGSPAYAIAALLGITSPGTAGAGNWPIATPLGTNLLASLQNPTAALANYWYQIVTSSATIGGQAPFYYMLREAATLFNSVSGGGAPTVTGTGTAADPWQAPITSVGGLSANVQAFTAAQADGSHRLVLGFGLALPLALPGGLNVDLGIDLGLLGLTLTATTTRAQILPGLELTVSLPNGYTTPAVGGTTVAIGATGLQAGWSPYSGWSWSANVGKPVLTTGGKQFPVGQDMVFTDGTSLQQLVTQQAQAFGQVLTGVLGLAVMKADQRAGLAFSGLLGLLPDLGQLTPQGLTWPSGMPTLSVTSFNNPLGLLWSQIAAIAGTPANLQAGLGLLAWASTGTVQTITGSGSLDDPFFVPLGLKAGIGVIVWTDTNAGTVGFGIGRSAQTSITSSIQATTQVTMRLLNVSLATGAPSTSGQGARIVARLANPSGQLLPPTPDGTSLDSISVGIDLAVGGTLQSPTFTVSPEFNLYNLTLQNQGPTAVVDLAAPGTLTLGLVQEAFNAALSVVLPSAVTTQPFGEAYDLLAVMGLAVPQGTGQPLGINPTGWNALLADPLMYAKDRLLALASDPDNQAKLFALLQQATGITLPTIPQSVLELLSALNIVQGADAGYAPIPAAFVQVFSHPAQYLQTQFAALLNDDTRLAALLAELLQTPDPVPFGPFVLQILSGPVVSLSLPPGTVSAGGLLDISGSLNLALNSGAQSLTLAMEIYNPQVKIGLEPTLTVNFSGQANFAAAVSFGDGTVPAPTPLQIWPFSASTFVPALAEVAPFYALSVLVSQVIDPLLLQKYPLVQALFEIFGIATQSPSKNYWHTKSLLGLFQDPVGWLLSDAILGQNGQLQIGQLNKLLANVPAVSNANGLSIAQVTNGITLTGLPYDLAVTLTADPTAKQVALTPSLAKPLPVGGGAATLQALSFSLMLGADFQPGFAGSIEAGITSPALSLRAGYAAAGFNLAVIAGGDNPMTLQMVPFAGWQALVQSAAPIVIQTLVQELSSKLMSGLTQAGAGKFAIALQTAATDLNVTSLVNALIKAGADAGKLESAALTWLGQRVTTANAPSTASAIAALLSPVVSNVGSQGGLVTYTGPSAVPITLMMGLNAQSQVGVWASIALPPIPGVNLAIQTTGIGLPVDANGNITPSPQIAFGVSIGVPIQGEEQYPTLSLAYDNGGFFTASLDPMGSGKAPSPLAVELLPDFFGGPKDLEAAVLQWLLNVLKQAVPRYLSLVVLNQAQVKKWLTSPLLGTQPGTALVSAGLIVENSGVFVLPTYEALTSLTVTGVLTGLAKSLLGSTFTVLMFNNGQGKIVVGPSSPGAGDCGVLLVAQNVALPGTSQFSFQIGAADSKWITDAGGPSTLQAGLGIFVPITPSIDFTGLKLQLVNVGVDFVGKQNAPLVQMSRFSLGAVQPRAVLAFDFSKGAAPVSWGGAMTLSDLALSLSPQTVTPGGSNPVAQNLLGSGSSDGSGGGAAGQATNPAFSIRAGYMNNGHLLLDLLQDGQESQEVWIPVQRAFGPLHVNQIGLELATGSGENRVGVGFDGSVSLAGLTVDVQKLTVSINLQAPTDYSQYQLDLGGLDVSFENGSVSLSGAFFKQENPLQYTGAALMKFGTFSLGAIGAYAVVPTNPTLPSCVSNPGGPDCPKSASLFIFVNLNAVLGGPPAFVVVGVAAGFGYNRNIVIPAVGDIANFPFVRGAMDGSFFPPDAKTDASKALTQISAVVPPMIGAYWVAAGIKFTSFELLTSFALLFVKFGQNFEIDLVGVTSASLPPNSQQTLVYVELGILISFRPADGVISVQAQLTPNSYLLAPSCKLTGGFALVIWFSGDFVVTLGGYHPAYVVPKTYPLVPRLGFNWPVSVSVGSLSIQGGAYFALTPTAIMAGGYIKVAFTLGPIRAWLNAGADFLVQWKPFYYDISIEVSIGVEFHTEILGVSITISASLGASLHLWGPETRGTAEVDWYVISFTIPIGDQSNNNQTNYLGTWTDFANNFLPPASKSAFAAAAVGAPAPPPGAVLKLSVVKGQAPGATGLNVGSQSANAWIMNSAGWQLRIETAIPATAMQANAISYTGGPALGVRPMNVPGVTTPLVILLQGWNVQTGQWQTIDLAKNQIDTALVTSDAPNALWSQSPQSLETPPTGSTVIVGVYVALTITGDNLTLDDPIGPIPLLSAFEFQPAPVITVPAAPTWAAPNSYDQTNRLARLMATIMHPDVIAMRDAVLAAIRVQGFPAPQHPALPVLAAYADALFQAPPILSAVGTGIVSHNSLTFGPPPQAVRAVAAPPKPQLASVRLIGAAHRYVAPPSAPADRMEKAVSLRLPSPRVTGKWVEKTRHGVPNPNLNAFRSGAPDEIASAVTEPVEIFEGTTALVGLQRPAHAHARVDVDGAVPVRLIELNQHDEVIGDRVVKAGTRAYLQNGTTKTALYGVSAGAHDRLVGWQRDSMLTQVGRYSFVGEGCTVRPQAPPEWKQNGRYVKHGLMEAAHVLRHNMVQIHGAAVPGWIETALAAPVQSVAIAVRAVSVEQARKLEVRLAWSDEPWSPVYEATAVPDSVQAAEGGAILHFNVPAVPEGVQAKWLGVLVSGSQEVSLEGVWGIHAVVAAVKSRWNALQAPGAGIRLAGEAPPSSHAVIAVDTTTAAEAPFASVGQA